MSMRTIVFATIASVGLALGGCADQPVQTGSGPGQSGYLGSNPAANAPTGATNVPAAQGSGQGGYLGQNAGADAGGPVRITEADLMKNPAMWCRMGAQDPGRCMGRGAFEHEYCKSKSADSYEYYKCRRAMDFIGYRP
jgi:hypothetical protein